SPPEGTRRAARRHALGRRAADVRHRPRADVRAEAAPARRAFRRPRAGGGAVDLRAGAQDLRRGLHGADRRAEHPPGAQGREPRVPAGSGTDQDGRPVAGVPGFRRNPQGVPGLVMEIFDVFLLEAILNGLLLGGLLALLSLGLNLIFGVIDVVWICYAELIMCGMYTVYYLHVQYHWPLIAAMAAAIVLVA